MKPVLIMLAMVVVSALARSGEAPARSAYVEARCARMPYTAVLMFTRHYDCNFCLVADVQTASPMVKSHWHLEMIDCDIDHEMAEAFDITAHPTFVAMVNGRAVGRHVGVATPTEIVALFKLPSRNTRR